MRPDYMLPSRTRSACRSSTASDHIAPGPHPALATVVAVEPPGRALPLHRHDLELPFPQLFHLRRLSDDVQHGLVAESSVLPGDGCDLGVARESRGVQRIRLQGCAGRHQKGNTDGGTHWQFEVPGGSTGDCGESDAFPVRLDAVKHRRVDCDCEGRAALDLSLRATPPPLCTLTTSALANPDDKCLHGRDRTSMSPPRELHRHGQDHTSTSPSRELDEHSSRAMAGAAPMPPTLMPREASGSHVGGLLKMCVCVCCHRVDRGTRGAWGCGLGLWIGGRRLPGSRFGSGRHSETRARNS